MAGQAGRQTRLAPVCQKLPDTRAIPFYFQSKQLGGFDGLPHDSAIQVTFAVDSAFSSFPVLGASKLSLRSAIVFVGSTVGSFSEFWATFFRATVVPMSEKHGSAI